MIKIAILIIVDLFLIFVFYKNKMFPFLKEGEIYTKGDGWTYVVVGIVTMAIVYLISTEQKKKE